MKAQGVMQPTELLADKPLASQRAGTTSRAGRCCWVAPMAASRWHGC